MAKVTSGVGGGVTNIQALLGGSSSTTTDTLNPIKDRFDEASRVARTKQRFPSLSAINAAGLSGIYNDLDQRIGSRTTTEIAANADTLRLGRQETAIKAVGQAIMNLNKTLAANSGKILSPQQRDSIVNSCLKQIQSQLNVSIPGKFIFGGIASDVPPCPDLTQLPPNTNFNSKGEAIDNYAKVVSMQQEIDRGFVNASDPAFIKAIGFANKVKMRAEAAVLQKFYADAANALTELIAGSETQVQSIEAQMESDAIDAANDIDTFNNYFIIPDTEAFANLNAASNAYEGALAVQIRQQQLNRAAAQIVNT